MTHYRPTRTNWRSDWDNGSTYTFGSIKSAYDQIAPYIERLNGLNSLQLIQFLHYLRPYGLALSWRGDKIIILDKNAHDAPDKKGIGQTWGK